MKVKRFSKHYRKLWNLKVLELVGDRLSAAPSDTTYCLPERSPNYDTQLVEHVANFWLRLVVQMRSQILDTLDPCL